MFEWLRMRETTCIGTQFFSMIEPEEWRNQRFRTGGDAQNRTGDGGFADLCLTTWLRRPEKCYPTDVVLNTKGARPRLSQAPSNPLPKSSEPLARNHKPLSPQAAKAELAAIPRTRAEFRIVNPRRPIEEETSESSLSEAVERYLGWQK